MSKQSKGQPRIQGKFTTINKEPLSKQVTGVRLPVSLHEWVSQKPDRTAWVRRVIVEAARKEISEESR